MVQRRTKCTFTIQSWRRINGSYVAIAIRFVSLIHIQNVMLSPDTAVASDAMSLDGV